ncbi:AAA family ATPase [Hymenobacter koreensis]|uniref:ATP-binding protein n=1 Tax=Hymenobacter koreensis TaxID=1084523 RepID=A0ABP8JKR9_9BACT
MLQLRKASRKQARLRIGVSAASGFGKTYGALLIAYGITGDWAKIAVIDSESGSAELYSDLGEFNALQLAAPFTPERYVEAIRACEQAGMEVIVIDSISHEWEGSGGCLEISDELAKQKYRGNSFQAWSEVSPRHQAFVDAILRSSAHVITTQRRKQAYELGTNDRGKTTVTKAGTKEIARDGFEYELTVNLEITNEHHLAKASKDRTRLFMGQPEFVIGVETGQKLKAWADTGIDPLAEAVKAMEAASDMDTLKSIWKANQQFATAPSFVQAKDNAKARLEAVAA